MFKMKIRKKYEMCCKHVLRYCRQLLSNSLGICWIPIDGYEESSYGKTWVLYLSDFGDSKRKVY